MKNADFEKLIATEKFQEFARADLLDLLEENYLKKIYVEDREGNKAKIEIQENGLYIFEITYKEVIC